MNSSDAFSLVVQVLSGYNLPSCANGAYCSVLVWNNPPQNTPGQAPKCTSIHYQQGSQPIEWNEKLQVNVANPSTEVLTVRVKDRSDSLIGTCNIYLSHLSPGETLDQWFQLHPTGHIHLKLILNSVKPSRAPQTGMFKMFQTIQMEQQKLLAEQLEQTQQVAPTKPSTANFFDQIEKEKQNVYDRINQQLKQHYQEPSHEREKQEFLDQLNQNLRQHQQAAARAQSYPNYSPMQHQHQYPGFAPGAHKPNQLGRWNAVREGVGVAANATSIASNLLQLGGLDLGALGVFFDQ